MRIINLKLGDPWFHTIRIGDKILWRNGIFCVWPEQEK